MTPISLFPNRIKEESIRKLNNLNFRWTKTLYQNKFKHIALFFTLFEGYKCNKSYEVNCEEKVLIGDRENKLSFKFHKMKSYA